MSMSVEADPLQPLAEEFMERYRRGERPSLDEYKARYPALASEIDDLFPALVEMERFGSVDSPPVIQTTGAVLAGESPQQLGEYRILREVGRGGMGIVYEAMQESLGRHVALKVLPPQFLANPTSLKRFRREACSAAGLHHSNIVPVFSVGEHGGHHYFAMQFIRGQTLEAVLKEVRKLRRTDQPAVVTTHDASELTASRIACGLISGQIVAQEGHSIKDRLTITDEGIRETGLLSTSKCDSPALAAHDASSSRVCLRSAESLATQTDSGYYRGVARIGLQVAEALAYAHEQGVLHRDIKPSNLLIDLDGTAWVADFGLAKLADGDDLSASRDVVGTLRYMAPERFDGRSEHRSDVYSLGVTLYELLTLCPAYSATNQAALIHQVLHESPPPLSRLDRQIPGDLETVVLKAMAKEPAGRYASAKALAEDLRRFLADRPILARRSPPWEQIWKWCRRNPLAATLAAALVSLFLIALPVTTMLWLRSERLYSLSEQRRGEAETNLARARATVDDYLTTVSESTLLKSPLPGLQPLRKELLQNALKYYEDFVQRYQNDPVLRSDLAAANLRVGEITEQIGSKEEALRSIQKSLALYESLNGSALSEWTYRAQMGRCLVRAAMIQAKNQQPDESIRAFERAIALLEPLVHDHPDNERLRVDLALGHHYFALKILKRDGPTDEAFHHLRSAIGLRRSLADQNPDDLPYHVDLATSESNFAEMLYRDGQTAAALESVQRSVAVTRALVASHLEDAPLRVSLSLSVRGMGILLQNLDRWEQGRSLMKESSEIMERVVTENPAVSEYRRVLATSETELGQALVDHDEIDAGLAAFVLALEHAEIVRKKNSRDHINMNTLASIHRGMGKALGKQSNHASALGSLLQAVAIGEQIAVEDSLFAYDMACSIALCSSESEKIPAGKEQAKHYADRAMTALKKAVDQGWKNVNGIERDPDLVALHPRPEFQALLNSMHAHGQSAGPRNP